MKLEEIINDKWLNSKNLNQQYIKNKPFPHIEIKDFLKVDLLKEVLSEFPDLAKEKKGVNKFKDQNQIKLASEGSSLLSNSAVFLNSYLQSDLMLKWLNDLTGVKEPLISDPYLRGAGYHELKKGGVLKMHVDFNKHTFLNLHRRLNLLIYLNEGWKEEYGGALELHDKAMATPQKKILPLFNTAVIFSTTSSSYHGNPDVISCPDNKSRKSLAYYYYSTERSDKDIFDKHSTLFIGDQKQISLKKIIKDFTPPILIAAAKKIINYIKK